MSETLVQMRMDCPCRLCSETRQAKDEAADLRATLDRLRVACVYDTGHCKECERVAEIDGHLPTCVLGTVLAATPTTAAGAPR